ncbi:sensor histidine kinase [Nocardia sp. CC201C]|uniref:sensor histidine kinase n=1 Tax=Nocardia sp. CC201C TaxID=3044575 RepID=UPI0024A96A7B|nr:sensor histidine kinase [Nocardia sp. CC201C]
MTSNAAATESPDQPRPEVSPLAAAWARCTRPEYAARWNAALVLVLLIVQVGGGYAANARGEALRALDPLGYGLLIAGPLLLLARRRYPLPVFYTVLAVTAAYLLFGYGYGPVFFALIVAFLTAGGTGSRWYSYPFVAPGYLLMVWPVPEWRGYTGNAWQQFGLLAWLIVLVALAEALRQRRSVLVARQQRAEAARRHEEEQRARALAERERRASAERLEIARELHDVLAHSLSLINVQSSVALELLDRRPEQAAVALSAIKTASRDALGEVHALLRSIRSGAGAAPTAPTVGIADLERLTEAARTAGIRVRSNVIGTRRRLPAVVDVAAARIIQESLTNVVRHAPGAEVLVTVHYSPEQLHVTVDNTRPTAPAVLTSPGGHGISGMTERAHALGGELSAGPDSDGGFHVDARLPLPRVEQRPNTQRAQEVP